jgi:sulfoxide reductase catalytic subunit YedY
MVLKRRRSDVAPSEISDRSLVLGRRDFMRVGGGVAGGLIAANLLAGRLAFAKDDRAPGEKLSDVTPGPAKYSTDEEQTDVEDATSYNNFYEFGTDKRDPARNAHSLRTKPWSIVIDGECEKPGTVAFEDLISKHSLEERVYRLRCVEAWSMVIPWVGIPLGDILKKHQPTSKAKYVMFETLVDREQLPGQKRFTLDWPYREGLRMDEAMHPLAILAVGLYGEVLPGQNGAPLRLVVPWKYGFKSIKSIVRIHFSDKQPFNSWNVEAPREYGFYANVNPEVDHPRWTQSRERRIGEFRKRKTLPFNGYADEVASLYTGMDLRKSF